MSEQLLYMAEVRRAMFKNKSEPERKAAWNELQKPFGGKFWFGAKDAFVLKDTVIYEPALTKNGSGAQLIDIAYNIDCLPPLDWITNQHAAHFEVDLRSRLGQHGIDIDSITVADDFARQFAENKRKLLEGQTITQTIGISNKSGRRLKIPVGFGF